MTRGNLRYTEEQFAEQSAKRARWQKGSEIVNTTSGGVESRHAPAQEDRPRVGKALPVIADARSTTGQPCAHRDGVAPVPLTKYRAVKTNGYASKREASRAAQLQYLLSAGVIRNLREQVKFVLIPKQEGERACSYICDFAYDEDARTPMQESRVWIPVVEDCKGVKTDVYVMKRKLMLMVHGIRVRET